MFKKLCEYRNNKKLCFSFASKSKKIVVSVCDDLDAIRIQTPYSNDLIGNDEDIAPYFSNAYKLAQDAGDEDAMEQIHAIRQIICK